MQQHQIPRLTVLVYRKFTHSPCRPLIKLQVIYIILLYPDERRPTTVRSNDTLVDTPFQLISGFFHVNQGILCSEHAEQASSRGVLERGGGNNRKWIETGSGLKPIRLQV